MYYVYILKSMKDGKLYTGCTEHLEQRVEEHNNGKSLSTKNRRPLVLIHHESFETRSAASKRERFLKTPKGAFEKYEIWQAYEACQESSKKIVCETLKSRGCSSVWESA